MRDKISPTIKKIFHSLENNLDEWEMGELETNSFRFPHEYRVYRMLPYIKHPAGIKISAPKGKSSSRKTVFFANITTISSGLFT